ncbi:hypothetical protein KSS87_010880 [Heliosperma pusillum]|nr:hypothetical protein KSS87_010880 [Heliosperma pusillum]
MRNPSNVDFGFVYKSSISTLCHFYSLLELTRKPNRQFFYDVFCQQMRPDQLILMISVILLSADEINGSIVAFIRFF